ncbi:MAG: hypothetical protein HY320_13005 [Armatimonadetes bacterium]|nr:hypothetical protein [Armatimonadota bacterium]
MSERPEPPPMLTDRYDPINLFDLLPHLCLQMEPVLVQLDRLLDDDALFQRAKEDLAHRYPQTLTLGRPSTPVEVILSRKLSGQVVQRLYGWSFAQTEYFVSDSIVLRPFCRLYLERAPDDTPHIRWAQLIGPETLEALNARVIERARTGKVTRGRQRRVDSTVVETNPERFRGGHPSVPKAFGTGGEPPVGAGQSDPWGEGRPGSRTLSGRSRTRAVRRIAQRLRRDWLGVFWRDRISGGSPTLDLLASNHFSSHFQSACKKQKCGSGTAACGGVRTSPRSFSWSFRPPLFRACVASIRGVGAIPRR